MASEVLAKGTTQGGKEYGNCLRGKVRHYLKMCQQVTSSQHMSLGEVSGPDSRELQDEPSVGWSDLVWKGLKGDGCA